MKNLKILSYCCTITLLSSFVNLNCSGSKSTNSKLSIDPVDTPLSVATVPQGQIISEVESNNQRISVPENNKKLEKKQLNKVASVQIKNQKKSYSNYIRVKTVYELAMEANPSMFFPHDEFETVSEYKDRVSGQVGLMKEIVQRPYLYIHLLFRTHHVERTLMDLLPSLTHKQSLL
jgi:hypothetical protein